MNIPIVMKTWAGSAEYDLIYISKSIPSLLSSDLPNNVEIIIYDDGSPNIKLKNFLKRLANENKRIRLIFGEENKGPNKAQEEVFSMIATEYQDTPFFVNVDDDVIYHRLWFKKLVEAFKQLSRIGLCGIFTGLNMPFKKAHSVIYSQGKKYILKWKQPALNWLIPKNVYEDIGAFKDEGIAYDTVYSHWMRLKGYSIICLTPSYVQNIGLIGAYVYDDRNTARDFLGEGNGYSFVKRFLYATRYTINRIPYYLSLATDLAAERIAPIRWGSEFVYEGRTKRGQTVAMFLVDDALKLGWTREEVEKRAKQILLAQPPNPTAILALRRSLRGKFTWIEYNWTFMPNLREYRKLGLGPWPVDLKRLFKEIINQLMPFHAKGIVHNKIRQDNIYIGDNNRFYLAWYGREPFPASKSLIVSSQEAIQLFGSAVSKWASVEIRELAATSFLEAIAPEVLQGDHSTPSSDVFSAAMIIYLVCSEEIKNLAELQARRSEWARGEIPPTLNQMDKKFIELLKRCVSSNSRERFKDAIEVNKVIS